MTTAEEKKQPKVPPLEHVGRFSMQSPAPANKVTPAIVLLKEGTVPAVEPVGRGRFSMLSPDTEEKEPEFIGVAPSETSSSFIQLNLQRLGIQFSSCRQVFRDGNSFYRAFMFAYLEHMLESKDVAEIARFKENINQFQLRIKTFAKEGPYEHVEDIIKNTLKNLESVIGNPDKLSSDDFLLQIATGPRVPNALIRYARYVTAAEILERSDYFLRLIGDGKKDALEICHSSVLRLGVEGNEYHVMALCSALGVPIRVHYVDQLSIVSRIYASLPSPNPGSASLSQVPSKSGDIEPLIEFAFWPGQYAILYRQE